jgi:proton-dependent oligopeptide transporter, POT family
VLYLINALQWQPGQAAGVYKWYTSLVYLTPLLGGFLADRVMGPRAAIVLGGLLMAAGHFALVFEPLPFFYAGLALLVAGNGFFKPNISTLVGKLYPDGDPRRDRGFTLFYMGINLGAFLGNIVTGLLADRVGWHAGFGAAGIGMVFGVVIYLWGQRRVTADVVAAGHNLAPISALAVSSPSSRAEEAEDDEAQPGAKGFAGALSRTVPWLLLLAGIALPIRYILLVTSRQAEPLSLVMPLAFGLVFCGMGVTLLRLREAARDKSAVIFVLFGFSILFWMAFEQSGSALNVWAAFNTQLEVASFRIPPT